MLFAAEAFIIELFYSKEFSPMPLIIPKNLPAYDELQKENVFIMHQERAMSQHIRPLRKVRSAPLPLVSPPSKATPSMRPT